MNSCNEFRPPVSAAEPVQDDERPAQIVEHEPLPAAVSRDPDDDDALVCALVVQAHLIVSRDKDLLDS
jgi:predicted nucleic acid-binding protein